MANTRKFQDNIRVKGKIELPSEVASKVLVSSATKEVTTSDVSLAELDNLVGVTSPIQAQITAAQEDADLGVANALLAQNAIDAHLINATGAHAASAISNAPTGNLVATDVQSALNELQAELDAMAGSTDVADLITLSGMPAGSEDLGTFSGSIIADALTVKAALQSLETSIESLPDPMEYKGLWDASTNLPALTDGTGNNGDLYQVTVAGTQFTPSISFDVGDKVVYNGALSKYEKWDQTESVASVFGRLGVVTAQVGDYDTLQVTENTNLYFTDTRAQTAAVVNSTAGSETVQAASVAAMKAYVTTAVGAAGSVGDVGETQFSLVNNQATPVTITPLAFDPLVVRSFESLVSIEITADSGVYEVFKLMGINKAGSFEMSVESTGDDSGIVLSITSGGAVQYTSTDNAGFIAGIAKCRAITTTV